jgi:hypothetical protein
LLKNLSGVCLLGSDLRSRGQSSTLKPEAIAKWLRSLRWDAGHDRTPAGVAEGRGQWLSAIPLEQSDGSFLVAFCVRQSLANPPAQPARHAADVAQKLKPLLDCVHRELAAASPVRSRVQALTERTAELEWLFKVTGNLKGSLDDRRLVAELLIASTERLDSALYFSRCRERIASRSFAFVNFGSNPVTCDRSPYERP